MATSESLQPDTPSRPLESRLITAPIRWEGVRELPILYANHMWVQLVEGQALLTFGRAELPYEPVTQEVQERLMKEGVSILGVSRLVIPPQRIPQIIQVLTGIYQNWRQEQVQLVEELNRGEEAS